MLPYIVINNIKFPTYFVFAELGICITAAMLAKLLVEQGMFRKYIFKIIFSTIGMLIGAKVFGILSAGIGILYQKKIFKFEECFRKSGIVYLGGVIGFSITLWGICKIKKVSFRKIENILAIVIPLFHVFGRIGCYLGGCCYGKEYNGWCAIPYHIAENEKLIIRFPTQLLEASFEMGLFVTFYFCYMIKQDEYDGKYFKRYLASYAAFRFWIENYRGDNVRGVYGVISFSQIVCICIMLFLVINYAVIRRNDNERKRDT